MTKSHSKRDRLNSFKARIENSKFCDVTLAEFADSNVPQGKGRLRKSRTILHEVRKISTSEDVPKDAAEVDNLEVETYVPCDGENDSSEGDIKSSCKVEEYTEYPLKIWLLLADYIPPEDVKSFSLICKAAFSVVNTPFFWIRLYKRYYNKKTKIPKCLSLKCIDYRLGLKQRVIRSLYFFYSPFVRTISNYSLNIETAVGFLCLHHWVYSVAEKDSSEQINKWVYNFKLCNRNINEIFNKKNKNGVQLNDIHYNAEEGCFILKIFCKEFMTLPNVIGMRLKMMVNTTKSVTLTFNTAPISRKPTDAGSVTIHLDYNQKPRLIPWWFPDYWEHGRCCRLICKA